VVGNVILLSNHNNWASNNVFNFYGQNIILWNDEGHVIPNGVVAKSLIFRVYTSSIPSFQALFYTTAQNVLDGVNVIFQSINSPSNWIYRGGLFLKLRTLSINNNREQKEKDSQGNKQIMWTLRHILTFGSVILSSQNFAMIFSIIGTTLFPLSYEIGITDKPTYIVTLTEWLFHKNGFWAIPIEIIA